MQRTTCTRAQKSGLRKHSRPGFHNPIEGGPRSVVVAFFRRHQALDAGQQFFLGHLVEGNARLGDIFAVGHLHLARGTLKPRLADNAAVGAAIGQIAFRLVNLHLMLVGMNEIFIEIGRRKGFVGDFAQGLLGLGGLGAVRGVAAMAVFGSKPLKRNEPSLLNIVTVVTAKNASTA